MPKNYQTALLERAKVQNIITVLPTGSGKTLVAVMFVEWIYQQELKRVQETGGRKRMTFFLTNSVGGSFDRELVGCREIHRPGSCHRFHSSISKQTFSSTS